MKFLNIRAAMLMASLCFVAFSSVQAADKAGIEERLAPVGKVCMSGDSCAASKVVAASGEPRSGESVYNSGCAACHTSGAAGAPKIGDAKAWSERNAARGLEALYTNAIGGYNAMPAKGLCSNCSDDEIKGAVDYLLAKSQ